VRGTWADLESVIPINNQSVNYTYFDRDLSWLSFNERIILEASNKEIPIGERINFLSIFSSNLDEFYRVRIPLLMALRQKKEGTGVAAVLEQVTDIIEKQLQLFGQILNGQILPFLRENKIRLLYNEPIPSLIQLAAKDYLCTHVFAFLHIVELNDKQSGFFPENDKIYLAVSLKKDDKEKSFVINIPSDNISRFFKVVSGSVQYLMFIDDIIKENLSTIFPLATIESAFSFKITRDAELDLEDEYKGDLLEKIERLLAKRDMGFATRFLYAPTGSSQLFQSLVENFQLAHATIMQGGSYHNLKDLSSLPVNNEEFFYASWLPIAKFINPAQSLFEEILQKDIMIHLPYHDFNLVLRFFNEAAIDPDVEEIYLTAYRMANNSKIAASLISASKNGKKVTVFVEIKARFDEANNIRWSKKMKEAGIKIIYSIPYLKVHAKVALIKKTKRDGARLLGLLSTGNFNENTGRMYTDHILFTSHQEILNELKLLFVFLEKQKKTGDIQIRFDHLLVAQFNLQERFLALINREILHAQKGLPAEIIIKINNLEEEKLINKLYEASQAGVKIRLLVRSICRLVPGVPGMSEHITVKRIVDRYLEHGRIFWFCNNDRDKIYSGSADWMNRNIYHRIEVCFPIYSDTLKNELKTLLRMQLEDNVQSVEIDSGLNNIFSTHSSGNRVRSQEAIYRYIRGNQ
jgi:polyphosphate kinase